MPSPKILTTLNIAHESALRRVLDDREKSKQEWRKFEELLDTKEQEIAALEESISEDLPEAEEPRKVNRGYEENIRTKWKNNWLADTRWLDIILDGDPDATRDQFLETNFETALEKQDRFRDTGSAERGGVNLKELDKKVKMQQERVREIKMMREKIGGLGGPQGSPRKNDTIRVAQKKGLKVEFKKHQDLHLRNMKVIPQPPRVDKNECGFLILNYCKRANGL